jgi:Mor family transcriptional regulator
MVGIDAGDLSPLIADFVDRLGLDNALKIVEEYRNQLLYVPMRGASKEMVKRLGQELADRLVAEYRGCQWRIPCASSIERHKRNALMRLRLNEGKRQSEIALEFNLTYGQVGCILRQTSAS